MLASALLVAVIVSNTCSWDSPGANRFTGNVAQAVQSYTDIPKETRNKLQQRLEKRKYDEIVDITRDKISGKNEYTHLRDMHFGKNQICRTISRDKWKPTSIERALIYCEDGHCLAVPTVCGNLSRITRVPKKLAQKDEPLEFETAAGPPQQPPEQAPPPSDKSFIQMAGLMPTDQIDMTPAAGPTPAPPPPSGDSFPPGLSFPPPMTPYFPPVSPPIPEIPSHFMFIIGLGMVALRAKFNK